MEFRHLRFFIAVAEELHFTRAAARLHIAQPHPSQEIRKLDGGVGAQLFQRNKRNVELTPAGEVFLERAHALFDAHANAIRAPRRLRLGHLAIWLVHNMALRNLYAQGSQ